MPCHFSLLISMIIPAGSSRSTEVKEGTFSLCWESVLSVDLSEEIQYPVPLYYQGYVWYSTCLFRLSFSLQNLHVIVPKKLGQIFPKVTHVTHSDINKTVNSRDVSPSLQNVFWNKHLCLQGDATIADSIGRRIPWGPCLGFGKCSPISFCITI